MKNEEGTQENFSRVASADPSDLPESKSDGRDGIDDDDVSDSRYSSCGESEFERYCSANSVMGTPSFCSSVNYTDCLESDFGSFRSFGLGDETSSLEGFSLGGRFERKNFEERKLESSFAGNSGIGFCSSSRSGRGDNELSLGNSEEFRIPDNELKLVAVCGDSDGVAGDEGCREGAMGFGGYNELGSGVSSCESTVSSRGNDGLICEGDVIENVVSFPHLATKDNGGELDSRNDFHREVTELEREEEELLRYGDLECDDSMYGGGSDDESGKNIPCQMNAYYGRKEGDGNPFVMDSSVAFGMDDWDNFLQETDENAADASFLGELHGHKKEVGVDCERHITDLSDDNPTGSRNVEQLIQVVKECPDMSKGVHCASEKSKSLCSHSATSGSHELRESRQLQKRDVRDTNHEAPDVDIVYDRNGSSVLDPCSKDASNHPATSNQIKEVGANKECSGTFCTSGDHGKDQDPVVEKVLIELGGPGDDREMKHLHGNFANIIDVHDGELVGSRQTENLDSKMEHLLIDEVTQNKIFPKEIKPEFSKDSGLESPASILKTDCRGLRSSPLCADMANECPSSTKTETTKLNEFFDDVLHEMEEILLDSGESVGPSFTLDKRNSQSYLTLPSRDGSFTASTSGTYDTDANVYNTPRIDAVEVFGAKQKKGDVSLSERLVGVKEYTVYKIRVCSGNDQWEVERRYRDFLSLYRILKSFFADRGWILPSQWSLVEKESKKFFGSASPDVVAERSVLIQECLSSILQSSYFSSPPRSLVWFLSPQGSMESTRLAQQSAFIATGTDVENMSSVGKTISLIVHIQSHRSIKQMLEAQYYRCAGCHKDFNEGKTLVILDFTQTFGWGKPRLCEYTGQLFCSSCHTNESAVLPARVLHLWDFTEYPVCQLAKSYLDSIHDKPMLCVSAVNPLLFSKVPALRHVMNVRKKIGSMLPYVRCPFHRSILKGLGSRRYLVDSIDFFALRDLVDLSKGAFSALPVMAETLSRKIREHIMEQCLQCCDVGDPCGARQACSDPSSLIFPFQEDEIDRCKTCKQVYHKKCFKKLGKCSCRVEYEKDEPVNMLKMGKGSSSGEVSATLDLPRTSLGSTFSIRLFSGLFSKAKPERSKEDRESGNVILMGSLPNTPV